MASSKEPRSSTAAFSVQKCSGGGSPEAQDRSGCTKHPTKAEQLRAPSTNREAALGGRLRGCSEGPMLSKDAHLAQLGGGGPQSPQARRSGLHATGLEKQQCD